MEYKMTFAGQSADIIDLFRETFTASEGAEEGRVIAGFVTRLLATTAQDDMFVVTAYRADRLTGAAIFSRMTFAEDARSVFILSPMAVAADRQGQGVGQDLLTFALTHLRQHDVDVALTYGDINFYGRVGFRQISQQVVPPPLSLSYPDGWLAQSLSNRPLDPLRGPSRCVEALNDPALW